MSGDRVRRVLDNNKLAILSGKVAFYEGEIKHHKTVCAACSLHADKAKYACDDGWAMLKSLRRAENALAVYKGYDTPGNSGTQESMFL